MLQVESFQLPGSPALKNVQLFLWKSHFESIASELPGSWVAGLGSVY